MRVVIDTNTVISGLLWHGAPRTVLDLARAKRIRLYTSPHLLLELDDVLYRPKFAARIALTTHSSDEIIRSFAALCTVVDAPPLPRPAAADPDDDAVLACAVAAHAEVVVSGDRHLLALSTYAGSHVEKSTAATTQPTGISSPCPPMLASRLWMYMSFCSEPQRPADLS